MNVSLYRNNALNSVSDLAKAVGRGERELSRLAELAPHLYPLSKKGVETTPEGTVKIYYNPAPPIKTFQQNLNAKVFNAVAFPSYINGGVPKRSYRDDCLPHLQPRIVVNLDMSTFFESISTDEVREVWQYGLNFSPRVAELLTKLTTHNGHLPRGAPSSGHLANLVFWDLEPLLVTRLAHRGVTYTRYVDDVSLSAKRRLSEREIRWAIRLYGGDATP